ncbi:MAG: hypothetical protein KIT76_17580 [Pseudolabrys sp.]|jgi:hypothetical protein|nr:hypothetical protein [Pseudolabrys sp.]
MANNEPKGAYIRSRFDNLILAFLTRGWRADEVESYSDRIDRHNSAMPARIAEAFANIDSKATGVLTHVSLMIAGLGLIAPLVANNDAEIGIVVTEIGVYLLIAVGCLRCLSIGPVSEMNSEKDGMAWMRHELFLRRELYRLCVRAAISFTLIVFLLLPVMFFWKPERVL